MNLNEIGVDVNYYTILYNEIYQVFQTDIFDNKHASRSVSTRLSAVQKITMSCKLYKGS